MFSRDTLNEYVSRGLLSVQSHPNSLDVCIYNYTQQCQYSGAWDDITRACRGLIIDWRDPENKKVLSNPFPKFFNWEEHIAKGEPIPDGLPAVYEKMDGWLGILYWLDGEPWIATRGSFASTGAQWATEWFRKYVNWEGIGQENSMDPEWTHLFEIISPGTKIVVNYPFEGLVWLTARHLKHLDVDVAARPDYRINHLMLKDTPPNYGGQAGDVMRRASQINYAGNYEALRALERPNEEGFVCVFSDGTRLKIKFDEYKRLHKIITGVSAIGIWEMLRDGKEINFENVPDEFFNWVHSVRANLGDKYEAIEEEAKSQFHEIAVRLARGGSMEEDGFGFKISNMVSRKDTALEIQKMTHPALGFAMLDKKDYSHIIWKMVRPHGSQPFKNDEV